MNNNANGKRSLDTYTLEQLSSLLEELGFYHPEPDFHPAWAHYEGMRQGRIKGTPEEFEAARKAAEKEGHGLLRSPRRKVTRKRGSRLVAASTAMGDTKPLPQTCPPSESFVSAEFRK
jgi:hypothetical protein